MSRDNLLRILLAALLAAAALWFVTATEWVEVDVNEPAKGEAARNPQYAVQAMLRALGARVVKQTNLDRMPPTGARLVLLSRHWDLFPDRPQRLRQWVEAGGHLIVMGNDADQGPLKWLPIKSIAAKPGEDPESAKPPQRRRPDADCRELAVPDALPSAFGDQRVFKVCGYPAYRRHDAGDGHTASWALRGSLGVELVRVPLGHGTVTVIDPHDLIGNRSVLRMDNPLAVTAALQVHRGAEYWFVAEEARDALVPWLWNEAWPAIALGLLALLLMLWRGAVQFGPVAVAAPNHRRSMTEQITGTAAFLQRHGRASLHAAQVRALLETAGRHVRNFQRLAPTARTQAIADASGLAPAAIAGALDPHAQRTSGQFAADLDLLETTRRRLAQPARPREPSTRTTP